MSERVEWPQVMRCLQDSVRDFRYGFRTLRKNPTFAGAVVGAIALGTGASTAIFSVTNAVLLRPLPYRNPDRLVLISRDNRRSNTTNFLYSNADFFDLRDATKAVFEELGGVSTFRAFVPREDGGTEQISKALVTTNFFRMMGGKIAFGRDFTSDDGRPQPSRPEALIPPGSVAILGYEYWQRRYGGDTAVIGHEMLSSGQRGPRIVGVLAPGFKLLFPPGASIDATPDYWVANNLGYDGGYRNLMTTRTIGKLKYGVGLGPAQEQAGLALTELQKTVPSWNDWSSVRLEPMGRYLVAEVRPAILALMGSGVFLLLIACANVTNLLLVRAALCEREMAVRAALGGGRWRLTRQMLAEALLLSALGTLLGVGLSWLGVQELLLIAPPNLPRLASVSIDWRVLAFAAASGAVVVATFGVLPVWRAAQPDVMQVLRGGRRAAEPGVGRLLRNSVVVAEVALSFVLLVGSGLMFRSFLALKRVTPGYDSRHVLTFFLARDWKLPQQQGRVALLREIQARLRSLPGVENATASLRFPLAAGPGFGLPWAIEPASADPTKSRMTDVQLVLPGYFETLRTPLLAGRTFTKDDNAPGRNLAVIDEFLAAKAFPNESAIGKRLFVPLPDAPWVEVIGVVAHQRQNALAEPGREQIYFTDGFNGIGVSRNWAIRTSGDPSKLAPAVRAEIAKVDRQLAISRLQPMEALVDQAQSGTRFELALIGVFAAVAALLAGLGIYGVVATVVRQRTAEIGVLMALGAAPSGVFRLVIGQGLRLSAAGVAIGLLAAVGLTRVMSSMLVSVQPTDPPTFAAMAVLFFFIASIASWLPARRAAALDPASALRND